VPEELCQVLDQELQVLKELPILILQKLDFYKLMMIRKQKQIQNRRQRSMRQ
jgi:hypothetical protein